ncbi:gastrula zinc finger protein XlCGF71.1-like [Eleutherodactylus coqui]|uniref:gastrula zinc finger protein XlCGF71.1-like n=1 Tax=Eleutherodactylus coqui TaxID=57060 RepID=UPI0034633025
MSKDEDLHGSEAEVSAHKTVHEVKTVFTCSECGVCLADRVELLKHQVKHSRPKPFESSVSKSFYNSELPFHVHHQLHTLQHPECPRSFNSKVSLQMYQKHHASGQVLAASELIANLSRLHFYLLSGKFYRKSNIEQLRVWQPPNQCQEERQPSLQQSELSSLPCVREMPP